MGVPLGDYATPYIILQSLPNLFMAVKTIVCKKKMFVVVRLGDYETPYILLIFSPNLFMAVKTCVKKILYSF